MLLLRVVSTPGVRKNVSLSVHFSAVPRSGGQHPRPLGVASHPLSPHLKTRQLRSFSPCEP